VPDGDGVGKLKNDEKAPRPNIIIPEDLNTIEDMVTFLTVLLSPELRKRRPSCRGS
jgi:hypothetical protein